VIKVSWPSWCRRRRGSGVIRRGLPIDDVCHAEQQAAVGLSGNRITKRPSRFIPELCRLVLRPRNNRAGAEVWSGEAGRNAVRRGVSEHAKLGAAFGCGGGSIAGGDASDGAARGRQGGVRAARRQDEAYGPAILYWDRPRRERHRRLWPGYG